METNLLSIDEWITTSDQVFREIKNWKSELHETGILRAENCSFEENSREPKQFFAEISTFLHKVVRRLISVQNDNYLYEETFLKSMESKDFPKEMASKHFKLTEEHQKAEAGSGEQVMEDYFAIIMEKASLMDEIKILRTENEMLVQSGAEHYEKLKQTMITLKDRQTEIIALQSSQKLLEEEKNQMIDVLKLHENQKIGLENEILEKQSTVETLLEQNNLNVSELGQKIKKLEAANEEIKNLEKSCRLKDDMIKKYETEKEQLLRMDEKKKNQIEVLKQEIDEMQIQRTQLGK